VVPARRKKVHEEIKNKIIDLLFAASGDPVSLKAIRDELGLDSGGAEMLHHAIDELISADILVPRQGGQSVAFNCERGDIIGIFSSNYRGFGFVAPLVDDKLGDLFISPSDTLDAHSGDLVVTRVMASSKRDQQLMSRSGRILRILRRGTTQCVGTLTAVSSGWVVVPDGTVFRHPLAIADITASNATEGDKVVVEVLEFPRPGQPGQGVIVEVLGPKGDAEVELESIRRQFGLPGDFPSAVREAAAKAAREFKPERFNDRQDISHQLTITIDPDDARDFDDAISLEILPPAQTADDPLHHLAASTESDKPGPSVFELGVHIADVSAFVPLQSPMDIEARLRGNSTYFPRYVIPMLPEVLSNGICSLQENQPRLTKSAFIRYDAQGRVTGARFANTIIVSKKRLTYRQAQAVIDHATGQGPVYSKGLLDSPPNPHLPEVTDQVRELLVNMDRLARLIRQRRLNQGMIVLDLPEVELVLDDHGQVIDAHPEDDSFTHKIIEMFMVEANEAVARFLTSKNVPVLRRVHPEPDSELTDGVRKFLTVAGRKVPRQLDRRVIAELLDSVRGTPIAFAVNLSVLKTFSTAQYSPEPLGHYALGSDNYAHFTSPIRRYADLVIHRCLDTVLHRSKTKKSKNRPAAATAPFAPSSALMPRVLTECPDEGTLEKLARHLSMTERRAQDAERELRMVKVLQLLSTHVGDIIDGVITGVAGWGIFVQSNRFLVEGTIRVGDLPDDYWIFEDGRSCLRGQRTGRRLSLGDQVKVQIIAVNIPARRMDLRLMEHAATARGDQRLRKVDPPKTPPKSDRWDKSSEPPRSEKRKKGHGRNRFATLKGRNKKFRRGR
jgi:ribonuclease R